MNSGPWRVLGWLLVLGMIVVLWPILVGIGAIAIFAIGMLYQAISGVFGLWGIVAAIVIACCLILMPAASRE